MRAVDIGIGHDDDAMVARLVGVELLADIGADGGDKRADGVAGKRTMQSCALHVEDLAAQGQDGLRLTVASLLAEPPAESPSTMKISDSDGSFEEQSASLPGSEKESSTFLRRVISRALRAASRAFRACVALLTMRLAGVGFSSRYSPSPWVTAL